MSLDTIQRTLRRKLTHEHGETCLTKWAHQQAKEPSDLSVDLGHHAACRCNLCSGALVLHGGVVPGNQNAHFFWHYYGGPLGPNSSLGLPDNAIEALCSCAAAGYMVYLWSYQTFTGVPPIVRCVDAASLLPFNDCQDLLLKEFDIANISDYVRVAACYFYGGVVCDTDSLWFQMRTERWRAPRWAHWIGSFKARPDGRSLHWDEKWASTSYLRDRGDELYIATPCRGPRGSPFWKSIIIGLRSQFGFDERHDMWRLDPDPDAPPLQIRCGPDRDAFNRQILHGSMIAWGLETACLPFEACSPLPCGCKRPDRFPLDQIKGAGDLRKSFCANGLWASTKNSPKTVHSAMARGSLYGVRHGSAWHACRLKAFGSEAGFPIRWQKRRMGDKWNRLQSDAGDKVKTEACPRPDPMPTEAEGTEADAARVFTVVDDEDATALDSTAPADFISAIPVQVLAPIVVGDEGARKDFEKQTVDLWESLRDQYGAGAAWSIMGFVMFAVRRAQIGNSCAISREAQKALLQDCASCALVKFGYVQPSALVNVNSRLRTLALATQAIFESSDAGPLW